VRDIIVASRWARYDDVYQSGVFYFLAGGPNLTGILTPTATLYNSAAIPGDFLGTDYYLGDTTGDGILDVVAAVPDTTVGGVLRAGAALVWSLVGLTGPSGPTAVLASPVPVENDRLTFHPQNSGLRLADVTGDSILDIIASAPFADRGTILDAGRVYAWEGGPSMVGNPSPLATLEVPDSDAGDMLAWSSGGIQFSDTTGDTILDIVARSYLADIDIPMGGTAVDAGAIYVWAGGASLSGTPGLYSVMTLSNPFNFDQLGYNGDSGVLLADLNNDGISDVIAASPFAARVGGFDAGAVFVFTGGVSGALNPVNALVAPPPVAGSTVGSVGYGVRLTDVTGDDCLDIIAGCSSWDDGRGCVLVLPGGSGIAGHSTALLHVPGALPVDGLTAADFIADSIALADLSGDGVRDVVAVARTADVGGVADAGAIYVWFGGPMVGALPPGATLTVPGAEANDYLGSNYPSPPGLLVAEVTGDGRPDVVAVTGHADESRGKIYVWSGMAVSGAVGPTATLAVPGAHANDQLGRAEMGTWLVDMTGDGRLDIVSSAPQAQIGSVLGAGAVYLFAGGVGLVGAVSPLTSMTVPGAVNGDNLGG
jgi:hypothetical protein